MKEERLEGKGVDGECMRKRGRLHKCTDKDKMYPMKYKGEEGGHYLFWVEW
jgi:hypothetical protein